MVAPLGYVRLIRVLLCGQKYFGQEVLRLLIGTDGVAVAGVCCPAATPDGREDRTHRLARLHGLPWHPAGSLRAGDVPLGTDLIVAAHSHDFIGRKTRKAARLGAIGYHPSLLPLRRGRDAVRWSIKAGDRVTGGTVFWLNDTVDGGPIAAQDWCFVRPGDTAEALWRRDLQPMGLRLISRVIGEIKAGTLTMVPQDHRLATWEPAMNPPPLFRPELPELGDGGWAGYRVVTHDFAKHGQAD